MLKNEDFAASLISLLRATSDNVAQHRITHDATRWHRVRDEITSPATAARRPIQYAAASAIILPPSKTQYVDYANMGVTASTASASALSFEADAPKRVVDASAIVELFDAEIWPNFLWRNHSNTPKCMPIQAQIPEKVDLLGFQLLFAVLYFVVWFSAIFGNLSVIYVVTLKQVKLSSVRSVFICNLAISDVVLSLTSLPITAVSIFTRDWVFPRLFCNLIGVFQGGSIFVSSFTLTAIAIDRYILIRHPATNMINVRSAMLMVLTIWLVGYVFALPVGIFSATANYLPFCGLFCEEFWPDSDEMGASRMRKSYGITVLVIQFGVPVLISSLCYWTIGRIIDRQLVKRKQHQIILQESENRLQNRKSRSSRMMLAMVMGLVLAWLPMNLINLWRDFDSAERSSEWYSLIFALCHVTAMTSAAWNPIIYSWFNPQFKETIRHALERRKRRCSSETVFASPSRGNYGAAVSGASCALLVAHNSAASVVANGGTQLNSVFHRDNGTLGGGHRASDNLLLLATPVTPKFAVEF